MADNEDVEMKTSQMSDLQCQENDKKDVSLDIKGNMGFGGPSLCPIGVGYMCNCEHNQEPLDEDDPKLFMKSMFSQMKALQTAMTVPLLQAVKTFTGNSSEFKQYVKDIERYAQMAKLGDSDIPSIVHITCTGPVADFVQRFMDEYQTEGLPPSWKVLKKLMTKRFGEITDESEAMAVLRRIRQGPDESAQMYSERLLRVAEDAYPPLCQADKSGFDLVQRQLLDIFCDGLFHDYLRMKVMRANSKTFQEAVEVAMQEQNLRKRFNLRSHSNKAPLLTINNENEMLRNSANHAFRAASSNVQSARQQWVPNIPTLETDNCFIEPMEIDHLRNLKCFKCSSFGHRSRNCPTIACQNRQYVNAADDRLHNSDMTDERQNQVKPTSTVAYPKKQCRQFGPKRRSTGQNRVTQGQVPPQVPDWVKGAECWICHTIGHLRRNCPNRVVPDRNRVPVFPRGNWNGPHPQEN